jgi:tripartite-type tricarboxylate transporter receptor subunit TctC
VRILNSDDVKKRFLVSGIEASSSSPEQLSDRIKSEMARIRRIIMDSGIRAE